MTFGQPYLRASATACRLIKSPISLITLQMPCRIRGCLMRTSLPVMMDLGPFAPKCDQQRAKKSFVVFCRNGTGKKNGKRENLQVWISPTEVDSSHAIYFPPTPGVSFCAHIAERHVMVAISVNQRIQKSQALRDPHGGVQEWKTHQSSTFRRKSSHGGLPQFQETTVSRMLHGYVVGRCHNSAHIPD